MVQFEAAKAALPTTQDPFEFYGTLQRLAALLHDSHTRARYPKRSRAYHDVFWPVETVVRQGRLMVAAGVPGLAKGTELTRVNQFSAADLLRAAASLTSAELAEAVQLQAPLALREAIWLQGGRAPFRIEGRSPSGELVRGTLDATATAGSTEQAAESPFA